MPVPRPAIRISSRRGRAPSGTRKPRPSPGAFSSRRPATDARSGLEPDGGHRRVDARRCGRRLREREERAGGARGRHDTLAHHEAPALEPGTRHPRDALPGLEQDRAALHVPRGGAARGPRVEPVPPAVVGDGPERLDGDGHERQQARADPENREALGQEQEQQRPGGSDEPRPPEVAGRPAPDGGEPREVGHDREAAGDRQEAARLRLVPQPPRGRAQGPQEADDPDQRDRREDQGALRRRGEEREPGQRSRGRAAPARRPPRPASARSAPGAAQARTSRPWRRQRTRTAPTRTSGEGHGRGLERHREAERQARAHGRAGVLLGLRPNEEEDRHRHRARRRGLAGPGLRRGGERRPERQEPPGPPRVREPVPADDGREEGARGERGEERGERLADQGLARRVELEREAGEGEPRRGEASRRRRTASGVPTGRPLASRRTSATSTTTIVAPGPGPDGRARGRRGGGVGADAHGSGARAPPLVAVHGAIVLDERLAELVGAVVAAHEVELLRLGRLEHGEDRLAARGAERPGGQARPAVGVVGRRRCRGRACGCCRPSGRPA